MVVVAQRRHNGVVSHHEERTELRGALWRGDGAELVQLLTSQPWPDDALQLIGDGLLVALRQHADGAQDLAGRCEVMLRARRWDGDADLADQLQARPGTAPARLLRPLPVDLEELAMLLEGDPLQGSGRIDLTTGQMWPQAAIDYQQELVELDEDDDDPDRWLWVDCEGARAGYHCIQTFIGGLGDTPIAERLTNSISGRGAFRRFKDTLSCPHRHN